MEWTKRRAPSADRTELATESQIARVGYARKTRAGKYIRQQFVDIRVLVSIDVGPSTTPSRKDTDR